MKLFSLFAVGILSATTALADFFMETVTFDCKDAAGVSFVLEKYIGMDGLSAYVVDGKTIGDSNFRIRRLENGQVQVWFLDYSGADGQANYCTVRVEE